MRDYAGSQAVAENKNVSEAGLGQKLDRSIDIAAGVGKYAASVDLPGTGEPGIDRKRGDAALSKRVRQKSRRSACEKVAERAVDLQKYRTIAAVAIFRGVARQQQSVNEKTVAGSQSEELLIFGNHCFSGGHPFNPRTAPRANILRFPKAPRVFHQTGGSLVELHASHPDFPPPERSRSGPLPRAFQRSHPSRR